ncbi:MAG: transmembrane 220 family protein [Spirosomataceae bacterium]
MKYVALFFSLVFVLFAGWQYNDPDPVLWIPIYGIAAYVSWRAYQQKFNLELLAVLLVISLAGAINLWLQMTAWEGVMTDGLAMKTPNQELARESMGLGICSAVFLVYYVWGKMKA